MIQNRTAGHLAALLTILIWGTTFISTKILLTDFQPVEILFFRFVMGFAALLLIFPRSLGKNIPPPGTDLRSRWPHRHLPLLSAGKHRPHLHLSLQRGSHRVGGAFFHRDHDTHLPERRGKTPRQLLSRISGGHGGHLPHQLQRYEAVSESHG